MRPLQHFPTIKVKFLKKKYQCFFLFEKINFLRCRLQIYLFSTFTSANKKKNEKTAVFLRCDPPSKKRNTLLTYNLCNCGIACCSGVQSAVVEMIHNCRMSLRKIPGKSCAIDCRQMHWSTKWRHHRDVRILRNRTKRALDIMHAFSICSRNPNAVLFASQPVTAYYILHWYDIGLNAL